MTTFVHFEAVRDRVRPTGLGWNNSDGASLGELGAQSIVVEGLVGEQCAELDVADQRLDTYAVMPLAEQENEARQIDEHEYLGRQPSTRSADRLIPPFAPVLCWWTQTIVPSIMAYSKSGSPDNAWNTFPNAPLFAQRRNRVNVEFQSPNSGCRSRQGDPVRAIRKTASRKRRLSAPFLPRPPGLPGSSGAIRSHCMLFKTRRSKTRLHFRALNQTSREKGIPRLRLNVRRP